jgi:hypothetical protein
MGSRKRNFLTIPIFHPHQDGKSENWRVVERRVRRMVFIGENGKDK